jgi:glycine oxidase
MARRYHRIVATDAETLVIGAGIIGCAVARELASRGVGTLVLDARDVGRGATQASAGMLAPYTEAHDGGPLLDLLIRSLDLYDGWIRDVRRESGIDIEYRRSGSLEVAFDAGGATHLQGAAHASGRCTWLDAEDLRRLEPGVTRRAAGALSVPDHGYVSAPGLTDALARAVVRGGGRIQPAARAISVDIRSDHVRVTLEDAQVLRADRLVVAAGSWTSQLRGLEGDAAPVRPIRGQLLRVRPQAPAITRVIWGPGCYLVPWAEGLVLVGATMEEAGFEERNTAGAVRLLLEAASTLVPALSEATFVDARSGLRPATPDGLPIVGPSAQSDRVVYATGHFRNGILLAPLTARLVADYLVDGRTDPAIDALRPRAARVGARRV